VSIIKVEGAMAQEGEYRDTMANYREVAEPEV